MKKTVLAIRVYNLAEQYNIQQTVVHTIINSYIDYCKDLLSKGSRIDFIGLCSLVPNKVVDSYNTTLAYECEIVADMLGLPRHTVYIIINEYLLSIREEILNGKSATIRGIVTINPIYENGKLIKIHSSISNSIKQYLKDVNSFVDSVRVHTSKDLKLVVSLL